MKMMDLYSGPSVYGSYHMAIWSTKSLAKHQRRRHQISCILLKYFVTRNPFLWVAWAYTSPGSGLAFRVTENMCSFNPK